MAMGWLKGLVAPAAFPDGAQQGVPLQQQQQGGPPVGGAPSPYGMAPAPGPQVAPAGPAPAPEDVLLLREIRDSLKK